MLTRDPASIFLYIALIAGSCVPFILLYEHLYPPPATPSDAAPVQPRWRAPHFTRNALIVLVPLAAFAGYLLASPHRFTVSPKALPIFLSIFGAWAIFTVIRGAQTGTIDLLVRNSGRTYRREDDPGMFWTSMIWNLMFGLGCLWLAVHTPGRSVRGRCTELRQVDGSDDASAACRDVPGGANSSVGAATVRKA